MIRVNLLGERKALKKKISFQIGHKLTVGCTLILLLSGLVVGWRYWAVTQESRALDAELANAQKETTRLHSVIVQVQQFEQRKAQLQQRVTLIEQLRKDQTGPVHMLDQISRSLPPLIWLTGLKQSPGGNDVLIEGRGMTLTALSDFVASLEGTGYFQRSVEIVSSTAETTQAGDVIKFQIRAIFQSPVDVQPGAPGGPAPSKGD